MKLTITIDFDNERDMDEAKNILSFIDKYKHQSELKIDDIGLRVFAINTLKQNGIYYVSDLLKLKRPGFLKLSNVGRKIYEEVVFALDKKGIEHSLR